jgi:hypothetical protein
MVIHFSQEVLEVLEALVVLVVLGVLVRVPLSIILPKTSMLVCPASSLQFVYNRISITLCLFSQQ